MRQLRPVDLSSSRRPTTPMSRLPPRASAPENTSLSKSRSRRRSRRRASRALAHRRGRVLAVFQTTVGRRLSRPQRPISRLAAPRRVSRISSLTSIATAAGPRPMARAAGHRIRPLVRSRSTPRRPSLQLFGLPNRVLATLIAQRAGAQTDDWAHVILDYGRPAGDSSHVNARPVATAAFHRAWTGWAVGSKYGFDRQERQLIAALTARRTMEGESRACGATPTATPAGERDVDSARRLRRFYAQLRDALNGAGTNPVPPVQALAVTAVVETAIRSSSERRALPLPLTVSEARDFAT